MTAPKRRWSFSLRTLFVVVTVFCCWLGWQVKIVNERKEMLARISEQGGGWGWARGGELIPIWRYWIGDWGIDFFVLEEAPTEHELEKLRAIFPEANDIDVMTDSDSSTH